MRTHRREFLQAVGAVAVGGLALHAPRARGERRDIEAVAFDAFTLLDGRPVAAAAERLVPGQGATLVEAWRNRLFQYSWLCVAGQTLAIDFSKCLSRSYPLPGSWASSPSAAIRRLTH